MRLTKEKAKKFSGWEFRLRNRREKYSHAGKVVSAAVKKSELRIELDNRSDYAVSLDDCRRGKRAREGEYSFITRSGDSVLLKRPC